MNLFFSSLVDFCQTILPIIHLDISIKSILGIMYWFITPYTYLFIFLLLLSLINSSLTFNVLITLSVISCNIKTGSWLNETFSPLEITSLFIINKKIKRRKIFFVLLT